MMGTKQHWENVQIQFISSPKKYSLVGGPFGSNLVSRDYQDAGVPVIRGANLPDHSPFSFENFVFISEEKADKLFSNNAYPGDLIFTQRGTLGQIGLIPENSPYKRFVISQSQMKLTVDRLKVDTYFVYYYFRLPSTVQAIENYALSSGIPHINLDILKKFEIPLPPLNVQKKIVAILSAYDDLIENNQRRIAILEKMAAEIYREWFVRMRFPGHGQVAFHKGIPEGWKVVTLDKLLLDVIDYRGLTPAKLGGEWTEEGIIALSALNVKTGRLIRLEDAKKVGEALYSRWMRKELQKLDILLTSEAPLGELHLLMNDEKYVLSQRLFALRTNPEIVSALYLYHYLVFPIGRHELLSKATGSTVGGIRQALLRQVEVLVPSKAVQTAYDKLILPILEQVEQLSKAITVLETTRNRLLPRLISGKLAVENLDIHFPPSMTDAEAASHDR